MQEIDSLLSIIGRNADRMVLAKSYQDVKKGIRDKKLVSLIGVEGGHMIEEDMSKFQTLYEKGMRYMTLTWNNSTSWASSAMDETSVKSKYNTGSDPQQKGLSDFGKQVVRKMNELGIIVDLSHVGEQTFYDAMAIVNKPVLLSHSSVYAISPVFRNVKDEQIKAVAKNGGVVCINFFSSFISKEFSEKFTTMRSPEHPINKDKSLSDTDKKLLIDKELNAVIPGIAEVIDHIDHIVKLVGINHVGIGSDFDGISYPPRGLEDVTTYPLLTEALLKRGYSKKEVKKILGKNVLRVMKANF
jgi:membrane dipeptidase